MSLKNIKKIISEAINELYQVKLTPEVTYPDYLQGDYATNAAFLLGSILKRSPKEIAAELAVKLTGGEVLEAIAAGPGFINLRMTDMYWMKQREAIDSSYGFSSVGKGKRVQVEFISANPTGPLTLGNARGGFIGDVIGNVLKSQGYEVTKEYYFNDAGTQIKKLVESVRSAGGVIHVEEVQYKGEYIKDLAELYREDLNGNDEELAQKLTQSNFEKFIKDAIDRMDIHFDEWFNEKSLVESGEFNQALALLKDRNLVYEQDGAVWLASSKYGDERDRVLLKSNGDITYLGNDIAYHINIFMKRNFDTAIKLWGADHAGQVPSLKLTIKELIPNKELNFVILQWVRLMQDGVEVKMSKRAGTFVTVQDLLDDLSESVGSKYAASVARWFFLMRSPDSQMDFDLGLAREQSQKNPLFYVLYSFARAKSIIRQAADRGMKPRGESLALSDAERALVRHLSQFPALLQLAADDYGVHRLTFYGYEAARLFHDLYESEKIIDLDPSMAEARLITIERYIEFMTSFFKILGIDPPERMDREEV